MDIEPFVSTDLANLCGIGQTRIASKTIAESLDNLRYLWINACKQQHELMSFSGDMWVLNKLCELANRLGVSPSVANVELKLRFDDKDNFHYTISMTDGLAETVDEGEKIERMRHLLGLDKHIVREFSSLRDVEVAVDDAISLAPRARVR